MNCQLTSKNGYVWKCSVCKIDLRLKHHTDKMPHRTCKPRVETPTFIQKLTTFTVALARFYRSGRGYLPKEKIEARLEICKSCPHFTGKKCRKCGCGIRGRTSLLNKLAYPTEKCPDGRWGCDTETQDRSSKTEML